YPPATVLYEVCSQQCARRTIHGGISLVPPPELSPRVHRVPPMLHSIVQRAMTSCSKGAWGLFVLSRGVGILTETAISPSAWSRQCPSRYAIRAGRNLPDKEFRYLRTVIVTAAVYRGFGSEPRVPKDSNPSP